MPPVFVSEDDFLLQNYTYELPQEQIAQYPPEQRGTSRLLTMRRNGALDLEHHMFSDLPDCLPEGSCRPACWAAAVPAARWNSCC